MTIRYTWSEGSIPPPGHYRLGVAIDGPDGRAWLKPGYGDGPTYEARFSLSVAAREALLEALATAGLWEQEWLRPEAPPVGGSHWRLSVDDGVRQATIHSDARRADGTRPQLLSDAVRAAVPASARLRLRLRHKLWLMSQ